MVLVPTPASPDKLMVWSREIPYPDRFQSPVTVVASVTEAPALRDFGSCENVTVELAWLRFGPLNQSFQLELHP